MATAPQITKKKKAVLDGVFKAELNNFLMKELAEDGYSGVEVCPDYHFFLFLFFSSARLSSISSGSQLSCSHRLSQNLNHWNKRQLSLSVFFSSQ